MAIRSSLGTSIDMAAPPWPGQGGHFYRVKTGHFYCRSTGDTNRKNSPAIKVRGMGFFLVQTRGGAYSAGSSPARLPALKDFKMRALWIVPLCLAAAPAWADDQPPSRVSFSRDVVPVLTRAGCNSGACHGSFQGRGGFRLSLLGFDAQADYEAIVREARGRRVFPALPEQSLILRKPTGSIAHGGGKRLDPASESYRVLRDWIGGGLPGVGRKEPAITRIEATPPELLLQAGKQQAIRIKATWADGLTRDVSAWALFESSKDSVAEIDANGTVTARQPGRAAIMVRYLGQVTAVPVTVPQAVAARTEK